MSRTIVTGIDIGTFHTKVVIAEKLSDAHPPKILGTGFSKSLGLRHGYIVNSPDIKNSLKAAISQAQNEASVKVESAYISFGGIGLEEMHAFGETIVSRSDIEITDTDVDNTIEDAKNAISDSLLNKKIIHSIPIDYKVDGEPVFGQPVGMHGSKLETNILFITAIEQHLNDIIESVEDIDIEVLNITASPIAASLVTLTKTQKMAGCVMVNIGAETTSLIVLEENIPVSIKVFPVGSAAITNNIALSLKIPLQDAEQLKLGNTSKIDYPRKKLDTIINSQLRDIFKLIDGHLKAIEKDGMLPAGVILTGGGASLPGIVDYARNALKLPAEIATTHFGKQTLKESTWAVSYGLCLLAASSEKPAGIQIPSLKGGSMKTFKNILKKILP